MAKKKHEVKEIDPNAYKTLISQWLKHNKPSTRFKDEKKHDNHSTGRQEISMVTW